MNYLEKIAERSAAAEKDHLSHPDQALPLRDTVWPESTTDPEGRNGENEEDMVQPDTGPGFDYSGRDRDSPISEKPQNDFQSPPVKPPIEIRPERIAGVNPERTGHPTIIPVKKKEDPSVVIPRERTTVIEKISERIVSGNIPAVEPDPGNRMRAFAREDMPATGQESFLPSGQKQGIEDRKATIQPVIRNLPDLASGKRISEKTAMRSFVEPGIQQQTTRKTETENKLIIGRITVEVTQSAPMPAPVPQRQYAGTGSPVNETRSMDKLSFGLGQL